MVALAKQNKQETRKSSLLSFCIFPGSGRVPQGERNPGVESSLAESKRQKGTEVEVLGQLEIACPPLPLLSGLAHTGEEEYFTKGHFKMAPGF